MLKVLVILLAALIALAIVSGLIFLILKKPDITPFFTASVSSVAQDAPQEVLNKTIVVPKNTPEVLQGKWDLIK